MRINFSKKEEVIFHEFDFETSDLEFGSRNQASESTQLRCDKGVFSFIIISQLRRPIELAQMFKGLLFFTYVEIH